MHALAQWDAKYLQRLQLRGLMCLCMCEMSKETGRRSVDSFFPNAVVSKPCNRTAQVCADIKMKANFKGRTSCPRTAFFLSASRFETKKFTVKSFIKHLKGHKITFLNVISLT